MPTESMAQPEPGPPPPAPAPDLERAEAGILAARSRLDGKSKGGGRNGWDDRPPEELEALQGRLWDRWRERNAARVSKRDLLLVPTSIAPDEVERFRRQTAAYLGSDTVADGFIMNLKRWLDEWRDWLPPKQPARSIAPSPQSEITLLTRMTGRKKGA